MYKYQKPLEKMIKDTQKDNAPLKDWSRIVIETDEPHPKVLAVVTNKDFDQEDGILVRMKPVYPEK